MSLCLINRLKTQKKCEKLPKERHGIRRVLHLRLDLTHDTSQCPGVRVGAGQGDLFVTIQD